MPELPQRERLQPALLDRLRDDEPDKKQESLDERMISVRELHNSVIRDLGWLFNCENLASVADLGSYPETARSVVNYGISSLSGRAISSADVHGIEQMVREAILNFEPRIIPESLEVKVSADLKAMSHNRLTFEIRGDLWAVPIPLEFLLLTEVDLETGEVSVSATGG